VFARKLVSPVIIHKPSIKSKIAIMTLKYFLNVFVLLIIIVSFDERSARRINGMAIPSEYAAKRSIPLLKFVSDTARVKMLPKIGP